MRAQKVPNSHVTSLEIHEERFFGSLTCHVLRDRNNTIFDHFVANSSTAFDNADAYDPYIYGKKTHRVLK